MQKLTKLIITCLIYIFNTHIFTKTITIYDSRQNQKVIGYKDLAVFELKKMIMASTIF